LLVSAGEPEVLTRTPRLPELDLAVTTGLARVEL